MAVQVSDNGDMQLALQVKDEGSAVLEKFADNADASFTKAAAAAEQSIEKAAETTKEATKKIDTDWAKVGGAVGTAAAAIGSFALAVGVAGMKVGDGMQNAAEKIGITAGALQEFHYAAGLVDLSGQRVNVMIRDMNRFLADTVDKGGKSAELLGKMGLDAEALKRAGPADAFRQITSALAELKDPMERTQASMLIFKKGGDDAFRLGGALKEAGNDARTFGLVMSNEAYQGSDKFYDSIYRNNQQLKGISTIVADHIAPAFGEMSRIFVDAVRDSGALRGAANALGVVLRGLGAVAVLIGGAFGLLGKAMGGIAAIAIAITKGDLKGAFNAFQGMKDDITETIKKIGELEGKLLGLSGGEGNKKMSFGGDGEGGFIKTGGQGGLHTWSDILPGAELKTASNDADFEAERAHYDRMTELHSSWQITLSGIDAAELQRRRDLWKNDTSYKLAVTESFFSTMAGLMETKSKTLFNIGKAFAIADTIMQTYRAAQGAYAAFSWIPLVGPALGIAAAGAAIAVGMARVNAIRSTTFGSAAATPVFNASPTTGIPTVNTPAANDANANATPAQAASRFSGRENVILVGEFFTQDWMREQMIPMINKAQRDGVYLDFHQAAA